MAAGRVTGRLITLLITGDDRRSLRKVELDNCWGMAVIGRRSCFEWALAREELAHSCIYAASDQNEHDGQNQESRDSGHEHDTVDFGALARLDG